MEDVMKRYQVPAFGHWNFNFYDDEIPISQYFESHFFGGDGEDLFKVVLSPCKDHQQSRKGKKGGVGRGGVKIKYQEEKVRKAKAVDEDLYKIPAELLYKMPKKKKLPNFCARCLCLNCIA